VLASNFFQKLWREGKELKKKEEKKVIFKSGNKVVYSLILK